MLSDLSIQVVVASCSLAAGAVAAWYARGREDRARREGMRLAELAVRELAVARDDVRRERQASSELLSQASADMQEMSEMLELAMHSDREKNARVVRLTDALGGLYEAVREYRQDPYGQDDALDDEIGHASRVLGLSDADESDEEERCG